MYKIFFFNLFDYIIMEYFSSQACRQVPKSGGLWNKDKRIRFRKRVRGNLPAVQDDSWSLLTILNQVGPIGM